MIVMGDDTIVIVGSFPVIRDRVTDYRVENQKHGSGAAG